MYIIAQRELLVSTLAYILDSAKRLGWQAWSKTWIQESYVETPASRDTHSLFRDNETFDPVHTSIQRMFSCFKAISVKSAA